MLIILLVCRDSSIVIVVALSSSLSLSCPSHPVNVVVVAIAFPPCKRLIVVFLMALALIVLLVCGNISVIIVILLSSSSLSLCSTLLCSAPVLPLLGMLTMNVSYIDVSCLQVYHTNVLFGAPDQGQMLNV